jgi:signal peptidase II
VFNYADANISVGVVLLLLFYRKEISQISLKWDSGQPESESDQPESELNQPESE